MARAIDILTLERVKMELEIPAVVVDHDALLFQQIGAAVDYVSEVTGINYASPDYDAASFPPLSRGAMALVPISRRCAEKAWQPPIRGPCQSLPAARSAAFEGIPSRFIRSRHSHNAGLGVLST